MTVVNVNKLHWQPANTPRCTKQQPVLVCASFVQHNKQVKGRERVVQRKSRKYRYHQYLFLIVINESTSLAKDFSATVVDQVAKQEISTDWKCRLGFVNM